MRTKNYFISDVHLGLKSHEEEKQKEKRLVSFLDSVKDETAKLFIVGDLFDCWIEYRKVVPKGYYRTLAKLNEFVEAGVEVVFFSGNHDFWLNTYLKDDVGLKLVTEGLELEINGKRFYLIHGDGLSKGDTGYKIVKKILRSRVNQFLYSLIHPDIGIKIAQSSSKKSRHQTNEKSRGAVGMFEFAEKKINEGFDYVIMGHFHKPQMIELKKQNGDAGFYITLGDWINNFSYGVFENNKFELKKLSHELH